MSGSRVHDLEQASRDGTIESDVCIVGTGPVGLSLARALAEKRLRVTMLERGPQRAIEQGANPDSRFDRRIYRGATLGRAFGGGGTSALWGGQLLPVRGADLHSREQIGSPAWPIPYADLAPHFDALEAWLGVMPGSFGLPFARSRRHPLGALAWDAWAPRFSKWMPFGRRNVYESFRKVLAESGLVDVCFNANAVDWQWSGHEGPRELVGLGARSRNGNALTVRARQYVICAGALESARCVLELNEAAGSLSSGVDLWVGRCLHDHLSLRLARVEIRDQARFQRLFAPVFVGGTMRSLRMELDNGFLAAEGLPALYTHFVADAAQDSGFAVLRDMLRGLQSGRLGTVASGLGRLPIALPGILEILFGRFVRQRLSFPRQAQVYLHCDFEQPPLAENRVHLGAVQADGHRRLHVDWDLGCDVPRIAERVRSAFTEFWTANGLDRVAALRFGDEAGAGESGLKNLYDIYHPAGTTRMSADPEAGVVDPNLLVHGSANVFVAGSAVFPSMGAANPTFTAMALALRLATFIERRMVAA